ncbi:hypothetical protein [Flavobacterium rhizosphaerae]|uniref:Uncharacterized protein n=1 Tax=Flavobacterium rhizosphaerae TaxID=3163298 RepID=A0ABW8YXA9_9FLAO
MKKIIAIVVFMLGLGFTANAQSTSAEPGTKAAFHEAALKDVKALGKVVKLNEHEVQMFTGLFESKHQELYNINKNGLSEQRKDAVYQWTDAKIRASISQDRMAKVDAEPELLKQLTH